MASLYHVPIGESFLFYMTEHRLDTDEARKFADLNRTRNTLLHEGGSLGLHDASGTAKRLLEQMVVVELQLDPALTWWMFPTFQIGFPVWFESYGWGKSGDSD